jgi:ubiquitin-protein ligase
MSLSPRILKEIKLASSSKLFDFFYDYNAKYGNAFTGYLRFSPCNNVYEGQQHLLSIHFTYKSSEMKTFPQNPPLVMFMTPIYHANISTGGVICLDVLKQEKWSALYNIEHIFNSIILLLSEPNIHSPLNAEAAHDYKKDNFAMKVAQTYARLVSDTYEQALTLLDAPEFKREESSSS